jgi:putative nucleotidyltransferase with HDIG domain
MNLPRLRGPAGHPLVPRRALPGSHRQWPERTLHAYRLALATMAVAALALLAPHQRPYSVGQLRAGSVAPERVRAPFLFPVPKSKEDLTRGRREAEAAVPTILRLDATVQPRAQARLDSVFAVLVPVLREPLPDSLRLEQLRRQLPQVVGALSVEAVARLARVLTTGGTAATQEYQANCKQVLDGVYSAGVIASKTSLLNDVTPRIRIETADASRELDADGVYSDDELRQGELMALVGQYRTIAEAELVEATHELLALFVQPNLTIDQAETVRRRADARRSVPSIKRLYARDEVIVEKGATVTVDQVEALNALAAKVAEQELRSPAKRVLLLAGSTVLAAFLVLVLGYYLALREPTVYREPGSLLLLAILVAATAASASYIRAHELDALLVPTPLAAMLTTILLGPQLGIMVSFLVGLYTGAVFGDLYVALVCSLTAAVAVYAVRRVRHRNQFYQAMILLPCSYILLVAATDLARFVPLTGLYEHLLPGIFTGVAAPILTIGLLPIFESLFRITTDITLLELSDLNRPLLRELAVRAPGTYTHSLIMANLSESAAEAIGANPLLARVGCYYHDIGKMLKPEYFTENQGLRGGRNPHDHLAPTMSMLIISSHVKDGLELAEEYGLPKALADLIPQHHGTTVIEYFYNRAIERGNEGVRRDDFRYDGPRPQTKEAGILMLADSVESAARTLTERTPNRVRQLVRNIVQQKFTAGQLDECALTLQDLHRIEESFVPVLMGTLHARIQYPWQRAERKRVR